MEKAFCLEFSEIENEEGWYFSWIVYKDESVS